ncbi:MAG: hypothetical protein AB7O45_11140 [Alphaproteobacteria bacterium]
MTDAVLEIVVDATAAEAGAARAVRALDDIRARAASVEDGLAGLSRRLADGGDAIATSLDDAARRMAALERAAGDVGGEGWTRGFHDAGAAIEDGLGGVFDRILAGGIGATRGLLDAFGRLAGGVSRMFGSGGGLDVGALFGGLARQAASGLAGLLPTGLGFLSPALGAVGGLVGSLLGGLFKRKPSNEGAEYAFAVADFAPSFVTTKHPQRIAQVTDAGQDLAEYLRRIQATFGVAARPGASAGATFGKAEGSGFYYDAGARDGGIENRIVAGYGSAEEAQGAAERIAVALLRDADWAALGTDLGRQVADHIGNSAAQSLEALAADIDFIAGWEEAVRRMEGGLADFAGSMRAAAEAAGRADGSAFARQLGDFLDQTQALGLPIERASDAARGMIETMAGLRAGVDAAPLSWLAEGSARLTAQWQAMQPILARLGYTAEEAGRIIDSGLVRAIADLQANFDGARTDFLGRTQATLSGTRHVPSGDALFRSLGLDPAATPDFARAIAAALASAREGTLTRDDLGALEPRFAYQYDLRRIAPDQLAAIAAALDAAVDAVGRVTASTAGAAAPAPTVPAPPGGTGPDAIAAARERHAREERVRALSAEIDGLEALSRSHREAAATATRLAAAFRDAAGDARAWRLDLATDPARSVLSPADQLAEAERQRADALARALAGGADAPQASAEWRAAAERSLELSRLVFGSSSETVRRFEAVMTESRRVEDAAAAAAQRQVGLAETSNAALARIAEEVAGLRRDLAVVRAGGEPGVTPGTAGAGAPVPLPTFGVAHLGRGAADDVASFLGRRFPAYAGPATEAAGLDWLRQPHGSGLGVTRQDYYAAATRAGFGGAFGDGAHQAFLSPGGAPDMGRWRAFIDALRQTTTVPYGFFGVPYAGGGLVVGGLAGRDSVPIVATPGERVLSVEQARMVEGLAANQNPAPVVRALDQARADAGRAHGERRHDSARLEGRIAALEQRLGEAVAALQALRGDLRIAVANRGPVGGAGRRTG